MQIKYVTAIFLLLTAPAYAQTGTAKTLTQLNTEINSTIPDNIVGAITPYTIRQLTLDMVASMFALTGTIASLVVTSSFTAINLVTNASLAKMPTQTVKCNDTGITANAADCTHLSFFFDKNGSNQTGMLDSAYDQITWSTAKFNTTGAALASNRWTAPVTGVVQMNIQALWNMNVNPIGGINAVKIIKNSAGTCNGVDVFAGVGTAIYNDPGLGIAQANGYDTATAGDVYEVCAFAISITPGNNALGIDGNVAHTFWSGAYIR